MKRLLCFFVLTAGLVIGSFVMSPALLPSLMDLLIRTMPSAIRARSS